MQIINMVLWTVGLLWAIAQGFNIRQKAKLEQATERTFEVHALLAALSVVVIPVLSLSSLHLLWMLPASFILGLASLIFPLNLLWIPASFYGSLWYIGVRDPGRVFYLSGDYIRAIECYEQSVQAKPNSAEKRFYLGLAYDKAGNKEKAIESFKEVLRIKPSLPEAYFNLGICYKDLGDREKTIDAFKEAVRLKPDYDRARANLGVAYAEVGDTDNALREYSILKKSSETYAAELHAAITAKNGNRGVKYN